MKSKLIFIFILSSSLPLYSSSHAKNRISDTTKSAKNPTEMPSACITNSDLSNPPHPALSPNDPCPLWNNSLNLALHPLQVLLLRFSAFLTLEALIPPPPVPLILLLLLVFPIFLPLQPNATQIASQASTEAIISTMSFSPMPEREEEMLWIESKRIRENSRIRFGKLSCLRLRIRCFVDRRRRIRIRRR